MGLTIIALAAASRRQWRTRRRQCQATQDAALREAAVPQQAQDDCSGKVALILNPKAKQVGKRLLRKAESIVGTDHAFKCDSISALKDALSTIQKRGYRVIACGGGDGTVSLLLNTLAENNKGEMALNLLANHKQQPDSERPTIAVLRLGTGNALSKLIGSDEPLKDLKRLVAVAQTNGSIATLSSVHPLIVNGKTLCFFAGSGIDAWWLRDFEDTKRAAAGIKLLHEAVKQVWFGYLFAFFTTTLPRVLRSRYRAFSISVRSIGEAYRIDPRRGDVAIRLEDNAILYKGKCWIVAAATMPFYGAGLRLFPFAGMRSGMMHLRVSRVSPAWCVLRMASIWRGHFRHKALFDFLVNEAVIDLEEPELLQHSGELLGRQKSIHLKVGAGEVPLTDFWEM